MKIACPVSRNHPAPVRAKWLSREVRAVGQSGFYYRGSSTEPVNMLSECTFQDDLAYYESTKDTASHFFIDYLPKGNYVFESSLGDCARRL